MSNTIDSETTPASAGPRQTTAGSKLKAAREAAGLSLDAVAQQLKLAPRQVKALEDDDWQRLPGRTFARGFARNYARFVRLDPDAVLALLPGPDTTPALERPALAASRRPMGEIPIERVSKPSMLRWLIPLLLVGVVAAIAYYEFSRSKLRLLPDMMSSAVSHRSADSPATPPPAARTTPSTSGTATTVLPNPMAGATIAPPAASAPKDSAMAQPAPATAGAPGAGAATVGAPAPEASLVLKFRGTSWVEVKDANGRVVVQMTGGSGMTQTVSAVPPIELALGNAPDVDVTFRGQPLDLSPYVRGGVARVALR
ncbi:MAG TPA: RodZ domain-containing protein [Casimicrobiaceae bacterium]|nr:RodZ domain-containing protein [Casimicrobiaceae bacterium]HXU66299.1 RodZ domain-containing protein [Casimicrobiaceae bacterium]